MPSCRVACEDTSDLLHDKLSQLLLSKSTSVSLLIKHRSCHFDERPVLPLNNSILLRCLRSRELV